ncbi:hypothetical protein EDB80DRAFT_691332 [Ilyonectria destructans]|nr:hypothetical protein EDB80DRAFT_691332 [Ilyonectria destructans]
MASSAHQSPAPPPPVNTANNDIASALLPKRYRHRFLRGSSGLRRKFSIARRVFKSGVRHGFSRILKKRTSVGRGALGMRTKAAARQKNSVVAKTTGEERQTSVTLNINAESKPNSHKQNKKRTVKCTYPFNISPIGASASATEGNDHEVFEDNELSPLLCATLIHSPHTARDRVTAPIRYGIVAKFGNVDEPVGMLEADGPNRP